MNITETHVTLFTRPMLPEEPPLTDDSYEVNVYIWGFPEIGLPPSHYPVEWDFPL